MLISFFLLFLPIFICNNGTFQLLDKIFPYSNSRTEHSGEQYSITGSKQKENCASKM